MSWLFSQALVAEYLPENSSVGEQSAPLNGNPTPQAYCAPDKMTAFSRPSRFGMTFAPLTEDRGQALLTSYLEAFRARTSALPEKATDLTESAADCGEKWRGWLAKFDHDSCLWRTAQCSLIEEEPESLQTLPRSGMTQDGLLWVQPTLERPISETDFGLWPTPTVNMISGGPNHNSPQVLAGKHGINLTGAVMKWATPTVNDAKKNGGPSQYNRTTNGKPRALQLNAEVGGALNPTWVEWLMGWPLGWTDLKPLETGKSPSAPQHLGNS